MEFWVICLSFHSVTCGAKISIRGRGYNSDLTPSLYVLSLSLLCITPYHRANVTTSEVWKGA